MAEREPVFWEVCLNLLELLAIPYLLEAEAVETEPGKWLLRLAYPELPGCIAEGSTLEDVLGELERRRVEIIVSLVEAGEEPQFRARHLSRPIRFGPSRISGFPTE